MGGNIDALDIDNLDTRSVLYTHNLPVLGTLLRVTREELADILDLSRDVVKRACFGNGRPDTLLYRSSVMRMRQWKARVDAEAPLYISRYQQHILYLMFDEEVPLIVDQYAHKKDSYGQPQIIKGVNPKFFHRIILNEMLSKGGLEPWLKAMIDSKM